MYSQAKKHFKKHDPLLYAAALKFEIEDIKQTDNLFSDITWTIIGQQLSGKVADKIFERFAKLFPENLPTPKALEKLTNKDIRQCGLSMAKIRALRDLSQKVLSLELDLTTLVLLSPEEIITELTKVKGIGPWTAEMVLIFSLGKADIFSFGDLGLKKGMMDLYGWKKLPNDKKLTELVEKWSPFRSYAARVLWKVSDQAKNNKKPKK